LYCKLTMVAASFFVCSGTFDLMKSVGKQKRYSG
jgi:hypothetical protein